MLVKVINPDLILEIISSTFLFLTFFDLGQYGKQENNSNASVNECGFKSL